MRCNHWSVPPVAAVSRLKIHNFPFSLWGPSRFARRLTPRFYRSSLLLGSSPTIFATNGFVLSAKISILLNGLDRGATVRYVDNVIVMKHWKLRCILHLRSLILQFLQSPQPRIQIRLHCHRLWAIWNLQTIKVGRVGQVVLGT